MATALGVWDAQAAMGIQEGHPVYRIGYDDEEKEEKQEEEEKEEKEEDLQEEKTEDPPPPPYVMNRGRDRDEIPKGQFLTPESQTRFLPTSPRAGVMDEQSSQMAKAEDRVLEVLQILSRPERLAERISKGVQVSRQGRQFPESIIQTVDISQNPWYAELLGELMAALKDYTDLRNVRQGHTSQAQRVAEEGEFYTYLANKLPNRPSVRSFLNKIMDHAERMAMVVDADNNVVQEARPAMRVVDEYLLRQANLDGGGDVYVDLPEVPEIRQRLVDPMTGQSRAELAPLYQDEVKDKAYALAADTSGIADQINYKAIAEDIAEAMQQGLGQTELSDSSQRTGPPLRLDFQGEHFSPRPPPSPPSSPE